MATSEDPLSPHLQIYKWHITMALSILHRGTGIFLSLGALFLSYWLLSIAAGPAAYADISIHTSAWYGKILLILFVFSFYVHLCNGIRHLFWDVGLGFEIKSANQSAYMVIIASVILTVTTCLIGMGGSL